MKLAMIWSARTDDRARTRTLRREEGAHAQTARARAPCVTPSRPRICMLSWQQMASFNVHREELHDLLQQRGTKEKRSLGDWSHLRLQ